MRKLLCGAVVLFLGILTACGGGGGGGGGNDVGSYYKGSTTQTTITASNAKAVTAEAVQGAQNNAVPGVLSKNIVATTETSPQLQSIAKIIEESIIIVSPISGVAKTVAATEQGTEYGYSGSFSYSVNGDQSTGSISGSINFNSYKPYSYSPSISGNISFNGIANTSTGAIININMSISNLQGVIGYRVITLNGTMAISNGTLNMSIVNLDNTNNNTYWSKDFSFVLNGGAMSISGTYYDHVYGYVVITTVTPLTVSAYSSTPTSGQLLFNGSNGTKARLTYTYTGYTLEVDATGNNTYVVIP